MITIIIGDIKIEDLDRLRRRMIGVVDLPRRKMMIDVVRMVVTKMNLIVAMMAMMMTLFTAKTILLIAKVATTIAMRKMIMMLMIAMIAAAMTLEIDVVAIVVTTTTMMTKTTTLMMTIVTIRDPDRHPRRTIDHHAIDGRLRRKEATPGDRFPSEGSEGNTRRCPRWCPRLSKVPTPGFLLTLCPICLLLLR